MHSMLEASNFKHREVTMRRASIIIRKMKNKSRYQTSGDILFHISDYYEFFKENGRKLLYVMYRGSEAGSIYSLNGLFEASRFINLCDNFLKARSINNETNT